MGDCCDLKDRAPETRSFSMTAPAEKGKKKKLSATISSTQRTSGPKKFQTRRRGLELTTRHAPESEKRRKKKRRKGNPRKNIRRPLPKSLQGLLSGGLQRRGNEKRAQGGTGEADIRGTKERF